MFWEARITIFNKIVSCNTHFTSINFEQFNRSDKTKFEFSIRYNPSILRRQFLFYAHIFRFNNIKCNSIDGFKRVAKCTPKLLLCGQFLYPMILYWISWNIWPFMNAQMNRIGNVDISLIPLTTWALRIQNLLSCFLFH